MKLNSLYCFFLLICLALAVFGYAQTDESTNEHDDELFEFVNPETNPDLKAGIKLGACISTMMGSETTTNSGYFSLLGGAYVKYKLKPNWFIQPEAMISRRGSNFSNGTSGYGRIQLYYIDLPVLFAYGLETDNKSLLMFGVQYSRLINSAIFKPKSPVPEGLPPRVSKNDFLIAAGTQFQLPFIGFQFMLKYGLMNINKGLNPNLQPANKGGNLHNFCFEFNFLF
jgi:hypothetical protein